MNIHGIGNGCFKLRKIFVESRTGKRWYNTKDKRKAKLRLQINLEKETFNRNCEN